MAKTISKSLGRASKSGSIPSSKTYTRFSPNVLSKQPTHRDFKKKGLLGYFPFRSVVRLGSITPTSELVREGKAIQVEVNTVESIKISSNKRLMKEKFDSVEAKTAPWINFNQITDVNESGLVTSDGNIEFPIVAKAKYGSKGKGNTLIKSLEEYNNWRSGKTMSEYIFEKFINYGLEYRLHISEDGCFYSCRKALKSDCPDDQKWRHHDDNCVWFRQFNDDGTESSDFRKPNSWNDIVDHCRKALRAIGADVLAFDVKVQSNANNKGKVREYQDFILLESNSAPSFGEVTILKYVEEIPKILNRKYGRKS